MALKPKINESIKLCAMLAGTEVNFASMAVIT